LPKLGFKYIGLTKVQARPFKNSLLAENVLQAMCLSGGALKNSEPEYVVAVVQTKIYFHFQ